MRDQYAGDISDLLKFSLLHCLAGKDHRLGIGWYYNPEHDGRSDGLHTEYRNELKWAPLDPVYNALAALKERSVAVLERLSIWPSKTRFHRTPVPQKRDRQSWAEKMQDALA